MSWSQVSISYWAALSWGKPFVKTISWKPEKKEKIGSPKHFVAKFPTQRESCRGGKELCWLLPTTPLNQHKRSTTKSEDFSFCCLSVCLHVSFCPFALCSFWLVVRTKHSTINKKKKTYSWSTKSRHCESKTNHKQLGSPTTRLLAIITSKILLRQRYISQYVSVIGID